MPSRYRKKPLAQFENGTRIYSPSGGEPRFRVIAKDPLSGERRFAKLPNEELARAKAREFEQLIARDAPIRDKRDDGARTVELLAERYATDHLAGLSLRYREKQEYVLRRWILPRIGEAQVSRWTPADSASVLAGVRQHGGSDALVQDVGGAMRALVTHARRMRWLTSQSDDPMWMVSYSRRATVQGAHSVYVPRAALPTDEECDALFKAMTEAGETRWALAMRLKHRSGLRWGELIALQPGDVNFAPRVVHVRRAVELGDRGAPGIKLPKNGRTRTTIFPKSLVDDLNEHIDRVKAEVGDEGWLFPGRRGDLMRRTTFQQVWIRAAAEAGWPMRKPLRRSAGYGEKGKGWRWTGSAQWSPHDLRHVAACWMLFDLGLDPAVVAEKLGHADPSFTVKRYVGVRGDPDRAAMTVTDAW
jgi:integrase